MPDAQAVDLLFVKIDVAIAIPQLREMIGIGATRHRGGEIRLNVDIHVVRNVARQNQLRPSNQEALVVSDGAIADVMRRRSIGIVPQNLVEAELRVASNAQPVEPVFLGAGGVASLLIDRGDGRILGTPTTLIVARKGQKSMV